MGRYSVERSYRHKCRKVGPGEYDISWVVDFYYSGSRMRYPRMFGRITDTAGAVRFCKKHNIHPRE